MESKYIGHVTVAAGTPRERKVDVQNRFVCQYTDNRIITVAKLVGDEGYVFMVENLISSGRAPQSHMWLSEESFLSLIASLNLYTMGAGIGYEKCMQTLVDSDTFHFIYDGEGIKNPFETTP